MDFMQGAADTLDHNHLAQGWHGSDVQNLPTGVRELVLRQMASMAMQKWTSFVKMRARAHFFASFCPPLRTLCIRRACAVREIGPCARADILPWSVHAQFHAFLCLHSPLPTPRGAGRRHAAPVGAGHRGSAEAAMRPGAVRSPPKGLPYRQRPICPIPTGIAARA